MVPPLGVLLQSPPNFGILYSEEEKCSLIWLFCSIFGGLSHSGKMTSLLNGRQPNAPNPKGWFWNPTSSSSENIPEPLPFVQLKYTQECCNALTISPSQYKEEDEQEVLSPGHRWSPLALLWPNPSSTSWQSHHSFLNFFLIPPSTLLLDNLITSLSFTKDSHIFLQLRPLHFASTPGIQLPISALDASDTYQNPYSCTCQKIQLKSTCIARRFASYGRAGSSGGSLDFRHCFPSSAWNGSLDTPRCDNG